jgi:hypothetical protein
VTSTLPLVLLLAAGAGAPASAPGPASSPAATSSATEPRDVARQPAPEAPRPAREPVEPSELLGRWVMQSEPGKVLELRSGGTGTFQGFPLTWSVEGSLLTVTDPSGTDTTAWKVTGDRLVLTGPFGIEIVFRREAARPEHVPDGATPSTRTTR